MFDLPGSATHSIPSRNYYLRVELGTGNRTVQDYGGNNTGYSGIVFVNMNSSNVLAQTAALAGYHLADAAQKLTAYDSELENIPPRKSRLNGRVCLRGHLLRGQF
ncbi:MAG: hypothetical protein IJS39_16270 [Synergistaceae bacterium]|nr:hypothetical protein [Synergistaceae bacterium]